MADSGNFGRKILCKFCARIQVVQKLCKINVALKSVQNLCKLLVVELSSFENLNRGRDGWLMQWTKPFFRADLS